MRQHRHQWVTNGDVVRVQLPHSEVCMHMRLAGQVRPVQFLSPAGQSAVVQILNEDGSHFSFPILPGEAGFYRGRVGTTIDGARVEGYYCYRAPEGE